MFRETFPVGALECNCTILGDEHSGEALVIDPGDDVERIVAALERAKLRCVGMVHTHAHIDHIGATFELGKLTGAKSYLHPEDDFLHAMLREQAQLIGLPVPTSGPIDAPLHDDDVIAFGAHRLGVLHTPGHTPGSVCFELVGEDVCFSGDTLFAGGIGRTDLWGGDFDLIQRSIRDRLYNLAGAVEVVPGHGPVTSIEREQRTNPFVRARR